MINWIVEGITKDKNGLEIGGISNSTGKYIYSSCKNLDNVIFSSDTVWQKYNDTQYKFFENKEGKIILNDAVNLKDIKTELYDFVFSSHCLEHIANPLLAISEWLRVLKYEGYLIIVVPEKSECFDHKRNYSKFETILSQYKNNIGENDLSTLSEILKYHDLSMDSGIKNFEEFKNRSLNNFNNRCLHHYVYDDKLLEDICKYFNCEVFCKETIGINRWFIMKK